MEKLSAKEKKQINKKIYELTAGKYFDEIPVGELMEILREHSIVLMQEDGTEWSGILCGDAETAYFDLAFDHPVEYIPIKTTMLALQWYKMESGRYEITTYMS